MKLSILKISLFLSLATVTDLSAQNTSVKAVTPAPTNVKKTASKTATNAKTPAKKTATPAKTHTDAAAKPAADLMPVMTFDKKTIDFGKIKTGDRPEVTYNFTNTGNAPLDIDIVSGCDCTELDWTRSTVPPGGKGFVKAVFNSKKAEAEDHKKPLKKYVDIVLKQMHPKSGNVLNESLTFEVFIVD